VGIVAARGKNRQLEESTVLVPLSALRPAAIASSEYRLNAVAAENNQG
jgi:hypothetical protein